MHYDANLFGNGRINIELVNSEVKVTYDREFKSLEYGFNRSA